MATGDTVLTDESLVARPEGLGIALTLTGALIGTLPLLVVFAFLGRRIITGIIRQSPY